MAKTEPQITGAPAWTMTFADLMSLLLAFFVLLFSFSELDKAKYKELAGSMRDAFGVQQKIRVKDTPKGINVIAREFSPGVPRPTPLNEVRQFTTTDSLPYPELFESRKKNAFPQAGASIGHQLADKEKLEKALKPELDEGLIELEMNNLRTVVRIKEKGVFPSGSDRLEKAFEPIMARLGDTLVQTSGKIVVAGHTDSMPIKSALFRSNWELSIARALTVAHVFFRRSDALAARVHLEAFGEFRPIDTNELPEGRARNRRVDIYLLYGPDSLALPDAQQGAEPGVALDPKTAQPLSAPPDPAGGAP